MKSFITLIFFLLNMHLTYPQENIKLTRIKCLKNMPTTYEEIEKQDTIYILYHKSDEKEFEQKLTLTKNHDFDNYNFYKHIYFPLEIYDYEGYEKVNFKKPIEMNKKKSFICENIKRVIDVYFLKKFHYKFYTDFYDKERIIFIIDLDKKIKNKYKIIQVNRPRYIIE